jgi:hypothetical protein
LNSITDIKGSPHRSVTSVVGMEPRPHLTAQNDLTTSCVLHKGPALQGLVTVETVKELIIENVNMAIDHRLLVFLSDGSKMLPVT